MSPGRPRLALRRKVMLALIASLAIALGCAGIQSASAATRSSLAVSVTPDRSNAVRLDGATVKGKIYVFVRNSETLDTVDFYLDSRRRTKPPLRTETDPPFDLAGTAGDGTAVPYDTTTLADGSHTIRVVLTWSDGATSSRRGNFTVVNGGATATPTAPLTTSPHRPADDFDYRRAGGTNYRRAGGTNYRRAGGTNYRRAGGTNYRRAGGTNCGSNNNDHRNAHDYTIGHGGTDHANTDVVSGWGWCGDRHRRRRPEGGECARRRHDLRCQGRHPSAELQRPAQVR